MAFLGTLGMLDWFRCIACGWETGVLAQRRETPDVDDMDGDESYAFAYGT